MSKLRLKVKIAGILAFCSQSNQYELQIIPVWAGKSVDFTSANSDEVIKLTVGSAEVRNLQVGDEYYLDFNAIEMMSNPYLEPQPVA